MIDILYVIKSRAKFNFSGVKFDNYIWELLGTLPYAEHRDKQQ